jgi:hypothetical protein
MSSKEEGWKNAWREGFDIRTQAPSGMVIEMMRVLPKSGIILDVGSGRGRDAIYLASK